jgi:hypothetical protein
MHLFFFLGIAVSCPTTSSFLAAIFSLFCWDPPNHVFIIFAVAVKREFPTPGILDAVLYVVLLASTHVLQRHRVRDIVVTKSVSKTTYVNPLNI